MSDKNETTVLVLALMTTLGLLAGAIWLFTFNGIKLTDFTKNRAEPNNTNYNTFAQATDLPAGLFSYGGSTTWAPIRGIVDPASPLHKNQPN